eukprot:4277173-Heterocapsa_arctica.AAC.1
MPGGHAPSETTAGSTCLIADLIRPRQVVAQGSPVGQEADVAAVRHCRCSCRSRRGRLDAGVSW